MAGGRALYESRAIEVDEYKSSRDCIVVVGLDEHVSQMQVTVYRARIMETAEHSREGDADAANLLRIRTGLEPCGSVLGFRKIEGSKGRPPE